MNFPFNARRGLVIVRAAVFGPLGSAVVSPALDTGATATLINPIRLMQLGYDPAAQPDRLQITTGSGVEFVPRISVSTLVSLGQTRTSFPVLCHTLPLSAGVDGMLGLDFLRGQKLVVNFRTGQVSLG